MGYCPDRGISEPVEKSQAAGDGPEFCNITFRRIGVPVDRYSQICINPESAGSSRNQERPPDPRVKETLFEGVVSLAKQRCAQAAHNIKRSRGSRSTSSRQPVIDLNPGGMQLTDKILAKANLYYLSVFRLQEDAVKEPGTGAYFKPGLGRGGLQG